MSGSEKRKRTEVVAIRLLPEERAYLEVMAREHGCSVGKYLRWRALPALMADLAVDSIEATEVAS